MNTLRFTKTHEWLQANDNEVTIGITDHAQQLLGDLVFIELPVIGESFQAGDELGVVESVKAASDFYAPVSGEVIAVNAAALGNPALVNTHPENEGWLVKLRPTNVGEMNSLLNREEYQRTLSEDH